MDKSKTRFILIELAGHLPFSIFGVSLGILLAGFLTFISILVDGGSRFPQASESLFHVFHPAHILFSAVATTSMFWKHDRNLFKATIIGFTGSVLICGLSDIAFPFVGGRLLGHEMHMHICLIEHPFMIVPFAVFGVIAGLFIANKMQHSTEYSHSAHVFISSCASILYLISFGITDWVHQIGGVFIVTVVAVMVPCCLSDIVYPLTCTHKLCGCGKNEG